MHNETTKRNQIFGQIISSRRNSNYGLTPENILSSPIPVSPESDNLHEPGEPSTSYFSLLHTHRDILNAERNRLKKTAFEYEENRLTYLATLNDRIADIDNILVPPPPSDMLPRHSESNFLPITEPQKKDEWYECIKAASLAYQQEHGTPHSQGSLWRWLHESPPADFGIEAINISKKTTKLLMGTYPLDRESFRKRYLNYFPTDKG
jgi:hypothetical protein